MKVALVPFDETAVGLMVVAFMPFDDIGVVMVEVLADDNENVDQEDWLQFPA